MYIYLEKHIFLKQEDDVFPAYRQFKFYARFKFFALIVFVAPLITAYVCFLKSFVLTLKDPFISESCIEIKIELNFYFTLLCDASKGFMKAFKVFWYPFWYLCNRYNLLNHSMEIWLLTPKHPRLVMFFWVLWSWKEPFRIVG